jgi:hypothetical protein
MNTNKHPQLPAPPNWAEARLEFKARIAKLQAELAEAKAKIATLEKALATAQMPAAIREVLQAMEASAQEAYGPQFPGAVYVSQQEDGAWIVGPNAEVLDGSLVFKPDGLWYFRCRYTGEDTLLKGGQEEAVDSARIWFTG